MAKNIQKVKSQKIIIAVAGIIASLILGFFCFGYFAGYGGNRCNISYHSSPNDPSLLVQAGSCDCFCCQMFHVFNMQGYESCGIFGLIFGLILGLSLILGIALVYWKYVTTKQ